MTTESLNNGSLPGLLEGVRVIDLTHYISGPYCTKLMATLGADVIKIERPGSGDPIRKFGPFPKALTPAPVPVIEGEVSPESGAWFLYLNTSKKSLTLDLNSDEGKDILKSLIPSAQIVVENFAPGTLDKMGLGYSDLQKLNPGLVMTSITNYGQTGPYRDWKATELNLYAAGGLMYITGEPESEPLKEGAPLAQLGAGQTAFVATMGALMHSEDTGQGQHIDLAIADYATNILENAMMQYSYSGEEYTRVGNRGYGRAAWGIYPCQDGYVGIISGPDTRWPEIAGIMEREELSDPRFASRNGRLINADEALYEIRDGIAYITMNRPEKMNAIDPEMRQILWDSFQDVQNNPEVRCAIVTGNGRAFSTGHDLVAMSNARANEGPSTGDLYVVQANIWKPIIAAINGICLAQGCGIALGSDIRVASSEAQFGWPQAKRGLSSVSGPALLSQVVPRNIAFEFLFTGDFVDAQRALDLMLVNYVVPPEEVMPKAEELARKITANAPLSIAAIKEVSIKGTEMGLEERVNYAQKKRDEVLLTEDAKEGVKAFAEKRAPVWTGR